MRAGPAGRSALLYEVRPEAGHVLAVDIARGDITLAVFGTPGIHDKETGSLNLAANLPGWEQRDSVAGLADVTGSTYVVENDVDLAALGEATYGLGRGVRHFVYLSIGTGTGMGVVIDGRLYRGFRGAAGEIGYLPIGVGDPLLDQPESRRRGMFESVASAAGVVATAQRLGLTGARDLVLDRAAAPGRSRPG